MTATGGEAEAVTEGEAVAMTDGGARDPGNPDPVHF